MTHIIPVGTSEPQDFTLLDEGVGLDGTGFDVELDITDADGNAVASPPTVAWLNQAAGTVRVTGVETLAVGYYRVRFKLTDGNNKNGFAPNGEHADSWRVVAVSA